MHPNNTPIGSWYALKKAINQGTAWLSRIADYYLPQVFRRIEMGQLTTCCDGDDQLIVWAKERDEEN